MRLTTSIQPRRYGSYCTKPADITQLLLCMKASFLKLWLPVGLLNIGGCDRIAAFRTPSTAVTHNDFETVEGWYPPTPSLTTERAHSGRFSVKVDPAIEYGASYTNPLSRVSSQPVRRLRVSAWALRVGQGSQAALVVQVLNPSGTGQQPYWQSLDVSQGVMTFNRWTKVKKTFELPAGLAPTHELRVYLWRTGGTQPVYLDDLELRAE